MHSIITIQGKAVIIRGFVYFILRTSPLDDSDQLLKKGHQQLGIQGIKKLFKFLLSAGLQCLQPNNNLLLVQLIFLPEIQVQ